MRPRPDTRPIAPTPTVSELHQLGALSRTPTDPIPVELTLLILAFPKTTLYPLQD